MTIVAQSTAVLHSLIPPFPLLAAPPARLALPAPKPIVIVEKRTWLEDFIEKVGPLRSIEEMNAELYEFVDDYNRPVWEYITSRRIAESAI